MIQDLPVFVAVGETTCFIGDMIAYVVADTMRNARAAAEKVVIDYEVLPPVTDPFKALDPTRLKSMPKATCTSIRITSRQQNLPAATSTRGLRRRHTSSKRPSRRRLLKSRSSSLRLAWRCRREKGSRFSHNIKVRSTTLRTSRGF